MELVEKYVKNNHFKRKYDMIETEVKRQSKNGGNMSNIIDFSDYHNYTKEEIQERAKSLEEELKALEKQEPELRKDATYFRLKNLFHATIEDMCNEEFEPNEIYLYFKGLNEIQKAGLDGYCQLVYSKLVYDFGADFLNLNPNRKIEIIDALTSTEVSPDNYSLFASFLLDNQIYHEIEEKNRKNMKKGLIEDLILSSVGRVTTPDEMLAYVQTELATRKMSADSKDTSLFPGVMTLDRVKAILQSNLQVASRLEIADAYSLLEKLSSIEELKSQPLSSQMKFLQFAQGVGEIEGLSPIRKADDILHISTQASQNPEYLIQKDLPELYQDAINHQNDKQSGQHK